MSDTGDTSKPVTNISAKNEDTVFAVPLTLENVKQIENGVKKRTDDDAKSVAGSEKSVSSVRSGIPKLSGLKPPSSASSTSTSTATATASKIGRPCAGQHKPAVPATPTKAPQNSSYNSYSSYDYMRKITDDIGRYKLTDVQETEEYEEDFFGNPLHMYPPRRNRYSSIGSTGTASSMDALWELHPRRLSEAGLSRHSDTSAILTEDTDSFIIGQRVWVGGTKPGQIAYIGDTQFAPGEWGGIVLDNPIGKNDGSVGGVRYFQCEAKRGVFSRLTRLTRYPMADFGSGDNYSTTPSPTNVHRRSPMSPTGSTKGLLKSPASALSISNSSLASAQPIDYRVGDRVIIKSSQGSKIGTLKYLGFTSFANGEWCGVELDEPRGKNDGSVNDKRYFQCLPNYGLFAPVSKVSKSPSSRKPGNCVVHATPRRANSRESLSNLSMASSAYTSASAARRVRIGVASLTPNKKAPIPRLSTSTPVPSRMALQDLLKEKQQHIEQLLKERDLERAEITRAASQADDAEQKLATLKVEYDQYQTDMKQKLTDFLNLQTKLTADNNEMVSQLDDEKRKNEDLQFKFEEAAITKGDIEVANEANISKIKELESQVEELQRLNETDDSRLKQNGEELERVKEENEALKVELEHASEKRSSLENEETKSIELVQSLQSQLEDVNLTLKQTQEDSQKQITQLNIDLAKLTSEFEITSFKYNKEIEESKSKYLSDISIKLEEIESLKTKANEAKILLDNKTKEFETIKYEATATDATFKKDLDRLKMDLSARNLESESRLDEINEKNEEIQKFVLEVDQLKSEVEKSRKIFEEQGMTVKELEDNLTKDIDDLRNSCRIKDEELVRIKTKLDESEKLQLSSDGMQSNLAKQLNETEQVLEKTKIDVAAKLEEINKSKIIIERLEVESKESVLKQEKLLSQLEENKIKLSTESSTLDEAKTKISSLELELGDYQRKVELNGTKYDELFKQKQTLEDEIKNLYGSSGEDSAKLENLNSQLREKEAELIKAKDEFAEKLQNSAHSIQQLEINVLNINQKLEKELSESAIKISTLEATQIDLEKTSEAAISEKIKENEELMKELTTIKSELQGKEALLEKTNMELEISETSKKALLEQSSSETQNIITDYQSNVQNLTQEIAEYKTNLQKSLEEMEITKKTFGTQIDDLKAVENKVKEDYEMTINNLRTEMKDSKENVAKLLTDLEELKVVNQSKEASLGDKTDQISKLTEDLNSAFDNIETLLKEKQEFEVNVTKSESELIVRDEAFNTIKLQLEEQVKQVKDKDGNITKKDETIEKLTQEVNVINSSIETLRTENDKLVRNHLEETTQLQSQLTSTFGDNLKQLQLELESKNAKLQDLESKLAVTQKDVNSNQVNLSEKDQELQKLNIQLLNAVSNLEKLQIEKEEVTNHYSKEVATINADQTKKCSDLLNQINSLTEETDKMKTEKTQLEAQNNYHAQLLGILRLTDKQKHELLKQLEKGDPKILTLIKDLKIADNDDAQEKILVLEQQISAVNTMLNNSNEKMLLQEKEITGLKNELKKSQEKTQQKSKIPTIPVQTDASIVNNNMVSDNNYKQLLEEKQFAEDQVQFLNSIIVDMQKKNEEQKARIEILESGYSPADADDLKLLGLGERKIAPRMYCDICEEFDLHETEDCPTQATDDSPAPVRDSPKEKPPQRPYCEICETFGHLTEDCLDDQTF